MASDHIETYLFFQLTILTTHFINLNLQFFKLVLFLQTTLKCTFTVLEQPSFPFTEVGSSYLFFNLINFTSSRALRLWRHPWIIGKRINIVLAFVMSIIILIIVILAVLIFEQLVERSILFPNWWATIFPFSLIWFDLRTILIFFGQIGILRLTRLLLLVCWLLRNVKGIWWLFLVLRFLDLLL